MARSSRPCATTALDPYGNLIMTHNWTDDTHLKPHNPGPTKVFGPNFLALKTLPPEARAVISNAGAHAPDNSIDPCAPERAP